MSNVLRRIAFLLVIPVCFVAGLHGGPRLAGLWRAAFPPPEYTTGDHEALYARAGNRVVMYATASCPYCAKARALLAAQGATYTEYRIDASAEANADFLSKQGVGVPLLYIGERRIEGFREEAIREAVEVLKIKNRPWALPSKMPARS
jgi:mycoredoxin